MSSCVPQGCVVQNCELGVCRVSPQMLLQKLCCPELWVSFITWFWSCNWERHGCTKSVAAWVVGMARCKCGNEWEGMHVVCCLLSMVLISKQQDNVSWLRIFWKACKHPPGNGLMSGPALVEQNISCSRKHSPLSDKWKLSLLWWILATSVLAFSQHPTMPNDGPNHVTWLFEWLWLLCCYGSCWV